MGASISFLEEAEVRSVAAAVVVEDEAQNAVAAEDEARSAVAAVEAVQILLVLAPVPV